MSNLTEADPDNLQDDHDDDGQHPKRQRVSLACKACQKKKIKCTGGEPCASCQKSNQLCVYAKNPRKPRVVKKPRKTTNINELETRLDRIERMLSSLAPAGGGRKRDAPMESDDEEDEEEEDEQNNSASFVDNQGSSADAFAWDQEPMPSSGNFINLRAKDLDDDADVFSVSIAKGVEHFCNHGTVFSLFTNSGLKWVSDKTGDKQIPEKLSKVLQNIHFKQQSKLRPFLEHNAEPAAPPEKLLNYCLEAVGMASDLISHVIVTRAELEPIVAGALGKGPKNGYSENCLLHAAVAMLTSLLIYNKQKRDELGLDEETMWRNHMKHTANAVYYFSRASLMGANLTALKAAIMLIVALQVSHSPLIPTLTPVAVRFAHELGLHRWESYQRLSAGEANRMRSIWWLTYCLDGDAAMKISRPPSIMDYDVSAKYPEPSQDDLFARFTFVTLLAKLFKISSQVYEKLFSAQAASRHPSELVRDILMLDEQLQAWREELPPDLRPGSDFLSSQSQVKSDSHNAFKAWHQKCALIHLHYCYYQVLATVHRVTAYRPSWIYTALNESKTNTPEDSNSNANDPGNKYARLFTSLDICVQSARSTIELVRVSKEWDWQFLWGSLYYSVNSFITLFIKCISRPCDMSTQYDLDLMRSVLESFTELQQIQDELNMGEKLAEFWQYLYEVAVSHVQRAKSTANSPAVVNNPANADPTTANQIPAPLGYDPIMQPQQQQPQRFDSSNGYNPLMADDLFAQPADASLAQSLYQVSSYFYSWDPEVMVYPDLNQM